MGHRRQHAAPGGDSEIVESHPRADLTGHGVADVALLGVLRLPWASHSSTPWRNSPIATLSPRDAPSQLFRLALLSLNRLTHLGEIEGASGKCLARGDVLASFCFLTAHPSFFAKIVSGEPESGAMCSREE